MFFNKKLKIYKEELEHDKKTYFTLLSIFKTYLKEGYIKKSKEQDVKYFLEEAATWIDSYAFFENLYSKYPNIKYLEFESEKSHYGRAPPKNSKRPLKPTPQPPAH